MPDGIYKYFIIREREIPQIMRACKESLGEYEKKSQELRDKYGIHKFMIYRNAARSERARKRGIDDPSEHMDVLVLFRKTDADRNIEEKIKKQPEDRENLKKELKNTQRRAHPGFTSVNGYNGLSGDGYALYKVDLRKGDGKEIFMEFIELHRLNPDDTKPYQYIANCFGLQHTLVPNRCDSVKNRFAYYDTFGERKDTEAGVCWLFAVPVRSAEYARIARVDGIRGLQDDFTVSSPAEEISQEEYLRLRCADAHAGQ